MYDSQSTTPPGARAMDQEPDGARRVGAFRFDVKNSAALPKPPATWRLVLAALLVGIARKLTQRRELDGDESN